MSTSAIIKTEAITLRVAPFSNTSHVVTWLTPAHGKIATVVKGACRPKSPVFGQYDIGFLCEVLFYERDRNGLHIIKECSLIDSRRTTRGNWQITAGISYMCHLASTATPDGAHAPELYELLVPCLAHLSSLPSPAPLLFWFELQLLTLLGIPPQFRACARCGCELKPSERIAFTVRDGGTVCGTCWHSNDRSEVALSGDVLAILRRWQGAPDFGALKTVRWSEQQLEQSRRALGAFLTHHVDLAPECRSVAYQLLNTPRTHTSP